MHNTENGHVEVVKLLLKDKRVDLSSDNNFVIKLTLNMGYTHIVNLLKQSKRNKK